MISYSCIAVPARHRSLKSTNPNVGGNANFYNLSVGKYDSLRAPSCFGPILRRDPQRALERAFESARVVMRRERPSFLLLAGPDAARPPDEVAQGRGAGDVSIRIRLTHYYGVRYQMGAAPWKKPRKRGGTS